MVEQTASFEVGLALLGKRRFDLVVVEDMRTAAADGDLVAAIREAQPGVRVIVIDPAPSSVDVIEAIQQKAYSYFSRPFSLGMVRDMMESAVRTPPCDDCIRVTSALPEFLSLRIRCTLTTADRLMQFMEELKFDLDPEERLGIATAFRELLMNAIEHGGNLNPEKWVCVSRVRSKRALVYHMEDPGPGFSREGLEHAAVSHPDASPVAHLEARDKAGLRMGGFGILMAKRLVDEVIYNEQGNEVIMVKHLD
jgi:anti-sigma regulatory factor (Ser/Thr protein kinase)